MAMHIGLRPDSVGKLVLLQKSVSELKGQRLCQDAIVLIDLRLLY